MVQRHDPDPFKKEPVVSSDPFRQLRAMAEQSGFRSLEPLFMQTPCTRFFVGLTGCAGNKAEDGNSCGPTADGYSIWLLKVSLFVRPVEPYPPLPAPSFRVSIDAAETVSPRNLRDCALAILCTPALGTCFYGSAPDDANYVRCGGKSPAAPNHCCSLNTTAPSSPQPADNRDGIGCLDLRCQEVLGVPRYYRMTPCGSRWETTTKWCCGGDDTCCGDEGLEEWVREIGTKFGEAVSTVTTTEGLRVSTTEAGIATTTSRIGRPDETSAAEAARGLAMEEKVGVGVGGGLGVLVALTVGFVVAKKRRREKSVRKEKGGLDAVDTVEGMYRREHTEGRAEMPGPIPLPTVLRQELS